MTRVKICGVTSIEAALACIDAGADALGINFVAGSVRRIDIATGTAIVRAVGDRALVVAVVAGMSVAGMRDLRKATCAGCLQLHGDEPTADVEALLPHAYKAIRVSTPADVARAATIPGEFILADAKVGDALGGTGHAFDWSLVVDLARARKLVLAGGLTPANVARAVAAVRPWCVDVASGVESAPGVKDTAKVRAFIHAVRQADAAYLN